VNNLCTGLNISELAVHRIQRLTTESSHLGAQIFKQLRLLNTSIVAMLNSIWLYQGVLKKKTSNSNRKACVLGFKFYYYKRAYRSLPHIEDRAA
jgi:hypothetical protein